MNDDFWTKLDVAVRVLEPALKALRYSDGMKGSSMGLLYSMLLQLQDLYSQPIEGLDESIRLKVRTFFTCFILSQARHLSWSDLPRLFHPVVRCIQEPLVCVSFSHHDSCICNGSPVLPASSRRHSSKRAVPGHEGPFKDAWGPGFRNHEGGVRRF